MKNPKEKEKKEEKINEEEEEKKEEENDDEEEDEYFNKIPNFILGQKHSSKINAKINMNLANLLKHIKDENTDNSKENYKNPIDSFLIFAITYKIFYDLVIAEYIFIYRCKNEIYICEKKNRHEFILEEKKEFGKTKSIY